MQTTATLFAGLTLLPDATIEGFDDEYPVILSNWNIPAIFFCNVRDDSLPIFKNYAVVHIDPKHEDPIRPHYNQLINNALDGYFPGAVQMERSYFLVPKAEISGLREVS